MSFLDSFPSSEQMEEMMTAARDLERAMKVTALIEELASGAGVEIWKSVDSSDATAVIWSVSVWDGVNEATMILHDTSLLGALTRAKAAIDAVEQG